MNRCPELIAPANGSSAPCANLPGHSCQFSCHSGYSLSGSKARTCTDIGVWTGIQPQCNGEVPNLLLFDSYHNRTQMSLAYSRNVMQMSWVQVESAFSKYNRGSRLPVCATPLTLLPGRNIDSTRQSGGNVACVASDCRKNWLGLNLIVASKLTDFNAVIRDLIHTRMATARTTPSKNNVFLFFFGVPYLFGTNQCICWYQNLPLLKVLRMPSISSRKTKH